VAAHQRDELGARHMQRARRPLRLHRHRGWHAAQHRRQGEQLTGVHPAQQGVVPVAAAQRGGQPAMQRHHQRVTRGALAHHRLAAPPVALLAAAQQRIGQVGGQVTQAFLEADAGGAVGPGAGWWLHGLAGRRARDSEHQV
jgi:hypothetical protein